MTAPLTGRSSGDSQLDPIVRSRWGVRLRELTPEASAPAIEPLDWQTKPSFWQRVRRSVAVPAAAAAAVFIAILVISVTAVWLRPHGIDEVKAAGDANVLTGSPRSFEAGSPDPSTADVGSAKSGATDAGAAAAPSAPLLVHVVGEVQRPGVYELKPGSRALAAIEAAGGATDSAVLSALNLARLLSDGEQLLVPNAESLDSSAATGTNGAIVGGVAVGSGLVSLNTADQAALETLPRVGPSLAQRIIEWRSTNGGFQSVDQLLNVSGIGQKTFDQLHDLVTL